MSTKTRPPIRVAVDPPLLGDTFIVEFEVGDNTGILTCHNLSLDELTRLRDACNEALSAEFDKRPA